MKCIIGIASLLAVCSSPSTAQLPDVWDAIAKINTEKPTSLRFDLSERLPEGGHLQGVQWFEQAEKEFLLLSGSSKDHSYVLKVPLSDQDDTESRMTTLLPSPYRHAGGIQIVDGQYAAIGLEDNKAKNTSKVWVTDVSAKTLGNTMKPLVSIEREGKLERATAGAIAMAKLKDRYLLVVGTWDSATLDFYESNGHPLNDARCRFEKGVTWSALEADRSDWTDSNYGSYQNLNLIIDKQGRCFLAGFCRNDEANRLDLYEWRRNPLTEIPALLVKRGTRSFHCIETTFQAGGGLRIKDDGSIMIYACSHRDNVVEVFE
ncbi:MAG: hypothetical protein P1U82_07830 [Verrucomicrobiales bacterium]|jgi:hypothetical protein|nr:hypothetical protein [Verrucomicrobiales bacterium]